MREHSDLVFTLSEYKRRLDYLRSKMAAQGIELAVITDQETLTYLTGHQTSGYDSFQALFVPLSGECFSVSRLLEESNFIHRTWVRKTFSYQDIEDPIQRAVEVAKDMCADVKTIGFEFNSFFLRKQTVDSFKQAFAGARFEDISFYLDPCRAVKSEQEIRLMEKAALSAHAAMLAAIEEARPGKTENDVAAAACEAMYRAGGEYPSVPPYIVSGKRTNIGHATWEGRTIKENECVFIELAGCHKRYHAAMMRTVVTGKPPKQMLEAEKIALEALHTSMENMKDGARVADIAAANQKLIAKNTCGAVQTGRSGYSIGISFAPAWDEGRILSLNPNSEQVFKEDMTIHLIPFFFLPEIDMIMGISETVRVGKKSSTSLFPGPERRLVVNS